MEIDEETEELDAAIEEYEAQQEEAVTPEEHPSENVKKQEAAAPIVQQVVATPEQTKEIDMLLKDAAALLSAIQGQLRSMDQTIRMLPKESSRLQDASAQIACVANGLSDDLKKQCLKKYQSILEDVGKNFNRLVHDADKWQKEHERALHKQKMETYKLQKISAILTPVLLLFLIVMLILRN